MVIDTSAVLAIVLGEPEAEAFARAIGEDPIRLAGVFTLLESSIVIEAKKGEAGGRELDLLFHHAGIEVVPMDEGQYRLARMAWRSYGKGRHRAGLNIGDCCSYALAKQRGEALLFKGDDFVHTDLQGAWSP